MIEGNDYSMHIKIKFILLTCLDFCVFIAGMVHCAVDVCYKLIDLLIVISKSRRSYRL